MQSPHSNAFMRKAWRCPCDGVSHEAGPLGAGNHQRRATEDMARAIERLTGARPPTCPWRSMYDPLVKQVLDVERMAKQRLAVWGLDADPPAILVDAYEVFTRARNTVKSNDEAEEAKRNAEQALAQTRKRQR